MFQGNLSITSLKQTYFILLDFISISSVEGYFRGNVLPTLSDSGLYLIVCESVSCRSSLVYFSFLRRKKDSGRSGLTQNLERIPEYFLSHALIWSSRE